MTTVIPSDLFASQSSSVTEHNTLENSSDRVCLFFASGGLI